jgi:hypothetical protein
MWRRPGSPSVSLVATRPGRFGLLAVLLAAMLWFAPAARAEGVPVGGLGPGGFADAYDLHPLWNRGDLGQGQTIVFFEVDGYSPADLAAYDARFGLPARTIVRPHTSA